MKSYFLNILAKKLLSRVFNISTKDEFNQLALEIFQFQAVQNRVYREYIHYLSIRPDTVLHPEQIPFLPVEFFKSHKIMISGKKEDMVFTSSGTTGSKPSKHYLADVSVYEKSFLTGFQHFYGSAEDYVILGLLPSYLERKGSSLIYMVNKLIQISKSAESGFYLHNYDTLAQKLIELDSKGHKILLLGVTYALLDLVEKYRFKLKHTTVMETGGMKGRRKEMIRAELHDQLKKGFGVDHIHSEYGMTELLSQAYSSGEEKFRTPSWMKIQVRDPYDPFALLEPGKPGGINIIDLANIYSCSFIETKDLGKVNEDGSFEILGRFDNTDIRGCNLLLEN